MEFCDGSMVVKFRKVHQWEIVYSKGIILYRLPDFLSSRLNWVPPVICNGFVIRNGFVRSKIITSRAI